MNSGVLEFIRRVLPEKEIEGKEVLEIGSQNVNGSPRDVIEPLRPKTYLGVDIAPGRGVDQVLDVTTLAFDRFFFAREFDVVISTEMLEHVSNWRAAVMNMKRVVRPGGVLLVTTRSPGFPFHGYPHDYWRYTIEDFRAIFADMKILDLEPDAPTDPGVFMKAIRLHPVLETDLSKIEVRRVS